MPGQFTRRTIQRASSPVAESRSRGFSLFELVVFIICVAIIYAYAANRFAAFPGQAERANFLAVTTQLQSAMNLELNYGIRLRGINTPELFAGTNPMDFMLEPPHNYLGAFDYVDPARVERRSWYFDLSRDQLVYLVNDTDGVFLEINGNLVPTDEIRFHIVPEYQQIDTATGLPSTVLESRGLPTESRSLERKLQGMAMKPAIPYQWRGESEAAMLDAIASS